MTEITHKGIKGLVLENDLYKVIILPELGAKIASFYDKKRSFELMYQPLTDTYTLPKACGNFDDYDMSGFDDCWPNIDISEGVYGDTPFTYPDHGDTWFAAFDYTWNDQVLTLTANGISLPYTFEKKFSLSDNGLTVSYSITNNGEHSIESFYTAHGLMNCEEDMTFMFPEGTDEVMNVVTEGSKTLGANRSIHPYPVAKDLTGNDYRLDKTIGPVGKCEKYYATSPVSQGKCGTHYPSINAYFIMTYDNEVLPYFGLWINERNPETHNYALEPSSGYYDNMDFAKENGKFDVLKAGDTMRFDLHLAISDSY